MLEKGMKGPMVLHGLDSAFGLNDSERCRQTSGPFQMNGQTLKFIRMVRSCAPDEIPSHP